MAAQHSLVAVEDAKDVGWDASAGQLCPLRLEVFSPPRPLVSPHHRVVLVKQRHGAQHRREHFEVLPWFVRIAPMGFRDQKRQSPMPRLLRTFSPQTRANLLAREKRAFNNAHWRGLGVSVLSPSKHNTPSVPERFCRCGRSAGGASAAPSRRRQCRQ